jgi:hypothetical protein
MNTEAGTAVAPATEKAPAIEETKLAASEAIQEPKQTAPESVKGDGQVPLTTPLSNFFAELPSIIKEAEYQEMWGVELLDASHVPTTIVLEKFLRANTKDVTKAKAQLMDALKWRKKMQPVKLLAETEFDMTKFGGLGYVTVFPKSDTHEKEIVTWNIYGAVKDNKTTFGNVEE